MLQLYEKLLDFQRIDDIYHKKINKKTKWNQSNEKNFDREEQNGKQGKLLQSEHYTSDYDISKGFETIMNRNNKMKIKTY